MRSLHDKTSEEKYCRFPSECLLQHEELRVKHFKYSLGACGYIQLKTAPPPLCSESISLKASKLEANMTF